MIHARMRLTGPLSFRLIGGFPGPAWVVGPHSSQKEQP
jgi:hypothetical protein